MAYARHRSSSRRKLALVIGNGDYVMGRPLFNTRNDAKQMANVLIDLGFLIYENEPKLDLTYEQFSITIANFLCSVKRNDLVLFYFAGHGIQCEDHNYLIPIDNFKEENHDLIELSGTDLKRRAINAQRFLNDLDDRDPFTVLFFLDCCRTYHLRQEESERNSSRNAFSTQIHGLKPMSVKAGSLIAFACAPGTTADDGNQREKNGLFTKHLLKHLPTSNESIFGVLTNVSKGVVEESNKQQIPHLTVAMTENIFLFDQRQEIKCNQWRRQGITIAGGNGSGDWLNQLSIPFGIFFNKYSQIFVADRGNHRIMKWELNHNQGKVVAGENGKGRWINQLNYPTDMIVDEEYNSLIISDHRNRRVIRWWNEDQQEILIDNISCSRIVMDKFGFLYVSDDEKHEVRRWEIKAKRREGKLVAGGNGQGYRLNQLNNPNYVFVDDEQSVYVSDCGNDRVMKWRKDAAQGTVVAGGNGCGRKLNQLNGSQGIIVGEFGQVFVADSNNHRVTCWSEGAEEGEIIIGGNGRGDEPNQLWSPNGLSLDSEGNLYVVDSGNHRVQRFDAICE
ncbi:unnamed protein product [Adineta ricciae]|uniref:Peptidase C14 caspase domain-containing protein n=1 Tax=Adineta ricciae TaxID=249248 RepID=A0A815UGV5_ADIRI|nr:unnamed protein product [Adineta ricciae]